MTESEAVEALKLTNLKSVHPFYDWEEMMEVRNIAMQALEKQIPKNIANKQKSECPEDVETYGEYAIFGRCPVCKSLQNIMWNNEYCGNCGQHIDWRNEG